MLFFQGCLAWAATSMPICSGAGFPPQNQATVHLAVVIVAAVVLPILPVAGSGGRRDGSNPTWRILLLLAGTVGLPYFAPRPRALWCRPGLAARCPAARPIGSTLLSNFGFLGSAAELSVSD